MNGSYAHMDHLAQILSGNQLSEKEELDFLRHEVEVMRGLHQNQLRRLRKMYKAEADELMIQKAANIELVNQLRRYRATVERENKGQAI